MDQEVAWNKLKIAIIDAIKTNAESLFAPNKPGLTPYERAAGFTELTRSGAKNFGNKLGKPTLEKIWECSGKFTGVTSDGEEGKGGCDGSNPQEYFESKSRWNTMKGSQAFNEIRPKLQHAISEGKGFTLLILVDKPMLKSDLVKMCKEHRIDYQQDVDILYASLTGIDDPHRNQNIPLHNGSGLSKINTLTGYDSTRHRWISGLEAFRYMFPKYNPKKIRDLITQCIREEFNNRNSTQ